MAAPLLPSSMWLCPGEPGHAGRPSFTLDPGLLESGFPPVTVATFDAGQPRLNLTGF